MKFFALLRQHLAWRLFLSYVIIVGVGLGVLDLVSEWQAPATLTRDIARAQDFFAGNPRLTEAVRENFKRR